MNYSDRLSGTNLRVGTREVLFLISGFAILSGALQRLVGGELQGNALLAESNNSNYSIVLIGLLFYAWCFLLLAKVWRRIQVGQVTYLLIAILAYALLSSAWLRHRAGIGCDPWCR